MLQNPKCLRILEIDWNVDQIGVHEFLRIQHAMRNCDDNKEVERDHDIFHPNFFFFLTKGGGRGVSRVTEIS